MELTVFYETNLKHLRTIKNYSQKWLPEMLVEMLFESLRSMQMYGQRRKDINKT